MANLKSDIVDAVSTYASLPTGAIITIAAPFSEYSKSAYEDLGLIPCDGRSLNGTTNPKYANLFSVIGTLYGGTGIAAFNIPNLKDYKLSIVAGSSTFYNTNNIGTVATTFSHSHAVSATNNSFSINDGRTDHTHNANSNIGPIGDGGHAHNSPGFGGNIGPNVNKNGPAGTAGGALNGNHSHSMSTNSNNYNAAAGPDHTHGGSINYNMGSSTNDPSGVLHTHTASMTMPANADNANITQNPFAIPYQNMLYFIRL